MKNNKIIAAFLVSMGMFTTNCAAEYVRGLSDGEKASFMELTQNKSAGMTVLNSSPQPVEGGETETEETSTQPK